MAETKHEVERKFEFKRRIADAVGEGRAALPDLTSVPGVTAAHTDDSAELDAVYYDTEDLALARAAITLRRRTGGHDAGWHLKLPVAADEREEIHVPLAPGDAEPGPHATPVPTRLAELTRARTRGRALGPVARLRTARETTVLSGPDGTALAEVSLDRVSAARLLAPVTTSAWTEVEVELADGAPRTVLRDVGRRLRDAGLRASSSPSKLARALATPPAPEPGEPATAGDHVMAYIRAQAERIMALDPAVRRDLPDSVHRLRVAARRLRSALRSYRPLLDPAVTRPLADELKWLAAELGADRDQEVLADRLRAQVAEVPTPLLLGPVEARLRAWDVGERFDAHLRSVAVLDSDRYLALLDRLDTLTTAPPLTRAARAAPRPVLARRVRKDYARLARRTEYALALRPGETRDRALHDARKAAKRARYAAEAARPALGRPAARFARRVKDQQKLLGDHHDSVVIRDALRALAVSAHAAGETAFTWGLLYGREEQCAEAGERELPRVWHRVSRPRLRRRLG
ncbi:CHAD domain-containing protein [Streptomyces sp. NPDC050560]|uniref:CYTH and CHAD domain-containing protein n=1 Tax=Streptomyces sp. NPDC050560 TaxID=3365630 RepID=UPI0037B1BE57